MNATMEGKRVYHETVLVRDDAKKRDLRISVTVWHYWGQDQHGAQVPSVQVLRTWVGHRMHELALENHCRVVFNGKLQHEPQAIREAIDIIDELKHMAYSGEFDEAMRERIEGAVV